MDELLHSRVEQLKQIEERIDDIAKRHAAHRPIQTLLVVLHADLRDMIAAAEREHAEF